MVTAAATAAPPAGRRDGAALLAPITLGTSAALLAVCGVLLAANGTFRPAAMAILTTVVAFAAVGSVLAARLPGHPVAWILCLSAVLVALLLAAEEYARWGLTSPGEPPPGTLLALWSATWLFAPVFVLLALLLPLLFPTGRLPSPRWWPVAWASVGYGVLAALGNAFAEQPAGPMQLPNPYAVPVLDRVLSVLRGAAAVLMAVAFTGAVASVVVRFVRARGEERQQLSWFASVAALLPLAVLLGVWSRDAVVLAFVVVPPVIAAAIGVAVLRYRLYALGPILNRTLVFSLLTAVVAALYIATVSVLGAVFAQRSDLVRSLAATMLIAAVFQPVRTRLQLVVDRFFYGDRSRPYDAVTRLGRRLETAGAPHTALPGVVETVAEALRLPYAEIVLRAGAGWVPAATYGAARGEPVEFPLVHQGETIGKLLVAPRSPGEVLGPADRDLLADLARQVSVAAHAVQLTADLRRSRAELVTAREEERRRVRRDLHDGLGPVLAGVTLGLDVARGCVRTDPAAAEVLLARLKHETQHAVEDVRRLVYGLRPPALDELGARQALQEQITRLTQAQGEVSIALECDDDTLTGLPAAVEVALYRIAVEAVTNVVRHAEAGTCVVRLSRTAHSIAVEVLDDGRGLPPDLRPGVGTAGMHERAQELGGSVVLEPRPAGGTRLLAHLPLPEAP